MTTFYTFTESAFGKLLLTSRNGRLSGIYFADRPHAQIPVGAMRNDEFALFAETEQQLDEYASGNRQEFDLPMDAEGTPFQKKVWDIISTIPFGQTITYGELAERAGNEKAVRAAGTATGANPIAIVVPCHRVMGKDGSLTGFAGGMERKKELLALEAEKSDLLLAGV